MDAESQRILRKEALIRKIRHGWINDMKGENKDLINRWSAQLSRWNPQLSNYDESRLLQMNHLLEEIGFVKQTRDNILVTSMILEEVKELTVGIELPEINKIHLQDLPTLRKVSSGDIVQWSSLENVVVNDCPNLKKFGLGITKKSQLKSVIIENQGQLADIYKKIAYLFELSDDEYSTMTEYNIDDSEKLGKALSNLQSSHFTNLLMFQAKNCDKDLDKFLHILAKRSKKLETLNIERCKTLYFLFDVYIDTSGDKAEYDKYFEQIKKLKLIELDQLEDIWSTCKGVSTEFYGFRDMQKIYIKSCPLLKWFLTESIVEELHQLNELKLEACERLYEIVSNFSSRERNIKFLSLSKVEFKSLSSLKCFYLGDSKFPNLKALMIEKCPTLGEFTTGFVTTKVTSTTDGESFSELNEVKLDRCHKLVVVISSKTLQELRNLKKLIVSHCKELEIVFNIHEKISHSTELLEKLDELVLIDLPKLTHVINIEIVNFYRNLQILQVKQCKSLSWLPMSQMLITMEILDCEALEKIVVIDKNEGINGSANFSQLKDVTLENLTNLSIVFPSTSEFPSLETLKVANCPNLMTFVQESSKLPEPATSNHFFPDSLSLDKLKVLHVINQVVENLWHYSCPSKSFCELENLTLSNNNKLLSVISSNMITRFNSLKKLTLDKCELLTEVFKLEDDKPNHNIQEMLHQLSTLVLSNLRGLICVWNREPQVPFFSNLVSIFIVHCDNLKSLFSHLPLPKILENSKSSNCAAVTK